jgi:squalene synthase HpnC
VKHYENFPVASWLCPAHLRPPIQAIYNFARTADDIADEGDMSAQQRIELLHMLRQELLQCEDQNPAFAAQWRWIFEPLAKQMQIHRLPAVLLADLLQAFEQDVIFTRDSLRYENHEQLLAYCSKSANPIGRLLMHLYGINEADALSQSDAICSALQLINFWQDLSIDIPRGRHYLPLESDLETELNLAQTLMLEGAPLALRVPGRAGWELRLVVQGGLKVLAKCQTVNTLLKRPKLSFLDMPELALRALTQSLRTQKMFT